MGKNNQCCIPKREIRLLNKGGIRNGFHKPRPQSIALNLGLNHLFESSETKSFENQFLTEPMFSNCIPDIPTYHIINLRKILEKA